MKTVKVEIKGVTPLLMNNPETMIEEAQVNKKVTDKTAKRNKEEEAEKLTYKDKGKLYVPAEAIKGSLLNASSFKKIGKYAAKSIVAGGVFIKPEKVFLNKNTYEIDLRTVVIQGNRVVKARPKVPEWKLSFDLMYNENLIANGEDIKQILTEAGQRIGILDFRPQKKGSFGMFEITKWQEQ